MNLNFLNGTPSVTFRFVFTSDPSVQDDGFSIDDFCITLPPNTDIGVDSILSPQSPAAAGASVPVQVRVRNYGLLAASNFNVYYKVDNGTAIGPTNYPGSLAAGTGVNVTCSNLTIPAGTHIISAYAVITNDGDHFYKSFYFKLIANSNLRRWPLTILCDRRHSWCSSQHEENGNCSTSGTCLVNESYGFCSV